MNLSKKHQLKNYLRIFVLLLGVTTLLWNCEKEEIVEQNHQSSQDKPSKFKRISVSDLMKNDTTFSKLSKNYLSEILSKNGEYKKSSSNDLIITSDTVNVIEKENYTSYTIRIKRKGITNFNVENLIIEQKDGVKSAHILSYKFDDDWVYDLIDGKQTKPTGKVYYTEYDVSKLKNKTTASKASVICYQTTITTTLPCGCGHYSIPPCKGSTCGLPRWPKQYHYPVIVCFDGNSLGGGDHDDDNGGSETHTNFDTDEAIQYMIQELKTKIKPCKPQENWIDKNPKKAVGIYKSIAQSQGEIWSKKAIDNAKAQIAFEIIYLTIYWKHKPGKIGNKDNLKYTHIYSDGIYTFYKLNDRSTVISSNEIIDINECGKLVKTGVNYGSEIFENESFHYIKIDGAEGWYNFPITKDPSLVKGLETMFTMATIKTGIALGRYVLPIEDLKVIFTGKNLDGKEANRMVAGGFLLFSIVPGSKALKAVKFVPNGATKWVVTTINASSKTINLHFKVVNGLVRFGSRSKLAKVIGTLARQEAHHIIPWADNILNNPIIQKAAKLGFHMNSKINGIALQKYTKLIGEGMHGNHPAYNDVVEHLLKVFKKGKPKFNSKQAKNFLENKLIPELLVLINDAKKSNLNLNEYFKKIVKPQYGL